MEWLIGPGIVVLVIFAAMAWDQVTAVLLPQVLGYGGKQRAWWVLADDRHSCGGCCKN